MSQPIDYARADADVVSKKFRRRVVMFVIATVVVMGIGGGWGLTWNQESWWIGDDMPNSEMSVLSQGGWITWYGPPRRTRLVTARTDWEWYYSNSTIGYRLYTYNDLNYPRWQTAIRYRTLLILAMIPWIITLIRLIRIWKRKHVLETEPRTQ